MTLTSHALWMLCLLGTVTFAAVAAARPRWPFALVVGAIAGRALSGADATPDPEVVGLLAVAGALLYLFSPRYSWLAFICGGAVAGSLVAMLTLIGAPSPLAVFVVAGLLGATVWLAQRRPEFAPELLRDEALIVVGVLGLVVAVLPGVLDGWQAAASLNVRPEDVAALAIPAWTLSVVVMSSLLGAAYALWSRR